MAARIAAQTPARVLDADALAHEALLEATRAGRLEDALGEGLVDADGRPDREAIARRVFGDEEALRRLEALVHPPVRERILEAVAAHADGRGPALLVLDVPLLIETGLDARCDVLWFVSVPEDVRRERLAARGLDREAARRREAHQRPLEEKRARADAVIENVGDVDAAIRAALVRIGHPVAGSS